MALEMIKLSLPYLFLPVSLSKTRSGRLPSLGSEAYASQHSPVPGLLRSGVGWGGEESCVSGLRRAVGRRQGGDGEAGAVDPRVEKGDGEGRAFPGS